MKNRTVNSIKNSVSSIISNICNILVGFVAQALFIRILGVEYLGLNGLFTNIIAMLGLFELGIGNAIVFNLYKPIAEGNIEKVKSLIYFYKKSYFIISIIIFGVGIIILPFIPFIVGTVNLEINIYLVYLLFLVSTVVSYFMVYKRNLLYASQQNYIINLIHCCYIFILNFLQIIILYFTKNYYLYLILKIVCILIENFIIQIICDRRFPFLKDKNFCKLDKTEEKSIFLKVKALIFHKIGYIFINGTDNIIISNFFNVYTVGLYNNYYLIVNALTTLFGQFISSTSPSVGNLLVSSDFNNRFLVFKKMRFLNLWISIFTSICFFLIVQPFISIWVGDEYKLGLFVLITIVFNYFQKLQRQTYSTFKDSAGIWVEDKYVPIIESVLNIAFSIICLKIFGLAGVFMGTIISGLALWCYSYPKFVYKKLFNRSYLDYAKETLGYILLFILLAGGTYYLSTFFVFNNVWIQLFVNALIAVIVPNVILVILFWRTEEFKYFFNLGMNILSKIKNKILKHA